MADREYVGCIHVHSRFSDGHTHAEEIFAVAARVGLDFLVMTDHNTDACRREGLTGWDGGLLRLSAPEIGTRHRPHFLAFGLTDLDALDRASAHDAIEAAARQGALCFVAHPHPARIRFYSGGYAAWEDWQTTAFRGIEIWSYMHDVCDYVIPWQLFRLRRHHATLVHGPRPETLSLWDALCAERRVAGIGALDNHARLIPLLGEILPHADLFRTLRTHVVCPELPADGAEAERSLASAMADGKAFVALDSRADAAGFRVEAAGPAGPSATLSFGQEASYSPGWRLAVTSPLKAHLTVIRNGQVIAAREACDGMDLAIDRPGVYRVEATLEGGPWVFANPVYLRDRT